MRRLWIDEALEVGAILYQPKPSTTSDRAWTRVTHVQHVTRDGKKATHYTLRMLSHAQTIQQATLDGLITAGVMLWEPPPRDPAALERWLASDQPTPPIFEPGTP